MRLSDKARAAVAAPNVRSRAHRGRSGADARIDIDITNHYAAKIYTTGDSITGAAVIRVPRDTPFDRVVVQFAGVAATRNYMMPEIDQVLHHFLLLDMPPVSKTTTTNPTTTTTTTTPPLLLPSDRILRPGRTYTLPFHFVVPERLPLGACSHRCEHPSVREHHLRLPPSTRAWGDRDDASPETARVQYCVSASVLQRSVFAPPEQQQPVSVLRGYHQVNLLPVHAEDAPLDVGRGGGGGAGGDKGQEYKLTNSKVLRKSLLSRKIGTVTVEAAQPCAVVISSDARQVSRTRIALKLAFFPAAAARKEGSGGVGGSSTSSSPSSSSSSFPGAADSEEALLPTVHSITAKLIAKTYYNTSHMGAFPDRERRNELTLGASMYYTDTGRATDVQFDRDEGWQRVVMVQHKNQAADDDHHHHHHHHDQQSSAWAMTLDARLQLPLDRKKILLPTFHSCLLSRTYTLRLALSVGPGRVTIALSVPLQVIVEPGVAGTVPRPPPDAVSGRLGMDAALPRYKDHLFMQRRYDDDINTLIPPGISIIM
ncbi:hypothetical protein G3M48_006403 [Beauveria asiatica]|uniref:Bul1 C-terminal domain-containing protein n=1 Tax=Beauveria asiatica TaxID=1069075 RepID=A0AAW0RP89_9HYPO